MTLIEEILHRYGGMAMTYELVAYGCDKETLRIFARFGKILHIKRGWWGLQGLSDEVIAARRAGGRLACVSALAHHGFIERHDGPLHVGLERSAKTPHGENIVPHWSRRRAAGDRQAVSVHVALAQARACRAVATGTL